MRMGFCFTASTPPFADSTRLLLAFILREQEIYVWLGTTHPVCGKKNLIIRKPEQHHSISQVKKTYLKNLGL